MRNDRCRCGRVELDGDNALIINDTMHESLDVENGFCGPIINHDLRNAKARVTELEGLLRRAKDAVGVAHLMVEPSHPLHEATKKLWDDIGAVLVQLPSKSPGE
jgi:hypothetical protein